MVQRGGLRVKASDMSRRLRAEQLVDSELTPNVAALARHLGVGPSKSAATVQWLRVDHAGETDLGLGVRFGHALSWIDFDDVLVLTGGLDHDHDRDDAAPAMDLLFCTTRALC